MRISNSSLQDFPVCLKPEKSYVICALPRSGSTFLSRLLWSTGLAGAPKEYLNHVHIRDFIRRWRPQSWEHYFDLLTCYRTSPNGVFGIKIQLAQLALIPAFLPYLQRLPHLKYVLLERKDILSQAVSYEYAIQSGVWSSLDNPKESNVQYHFASILEKLQMIKKRQHIWREILKSANITPIEIRYEAMISDRHKTIFDLLHKLDIEVPERFKLPHPISSRLSSDTKKQWREKFERDLKRAEHHHGLASDKLLQG